MNVMALCSELNAEKAAPEWIELLPAGPDIVGRDGRSWRLSDPKKVAEAFNKQGMSLVIDYEHSTEVKAPKGDEAPAAGWIESVEVRDDGSVWGKVDWTKKANNSIVDKEYRFISPAFNHTTSGEITRLRSVALTNKPNLTLLALNSQDEWGEVAQALGVESISSPQDVLKALNREKQSTANKIVDEVIAQAIFCPAQREHLIAMCSQVGEEQFREFTKIQLNTFGKMVNTTKGHRDYSKINNSRLNESQVAVCRNTGVSEDDYLTALGKENG
ncbi:phage protease [Klebsiella grimontii]|uniref:phage protease n=1 Tax=Klebsiella grimontii TaxID=2058152 RepID=UPI001CCCCABE|nr:phage protease [Klebsiella grimontii]MBZ7341444.1 hypothetical protein [Klebsiella grimontii]